nr:immunoglobulin light chain junction region [Mus musculus]NSM00539.1 immunoglobulin light chain junction region [Mus musculus]NSM01543.1 immunoglobulin light chain junction region [Mus musculus]NSM02387.1 immunoglobulin light chain junction region [Mus musculus]NSM02472.1 immunoglobulin light chain junction region [Mus musculus]
CQHSRELPPTF